MTANSLDQIMFPVIGLPSQLRDAVLSYADSKENSHTSTHESDVTRDYKMQEYMQNPTANNNQDESDNRLIKIARTVAHHRHQHRIAVSAPASSSFLATNVPTISIESHRYTRVYSADSRHLDNNIPSQAIKVNLSSFQCSVAGDVHLLGDLEKQEFSIVGHEFFPQPSITALVVQDSSCSMGRNKKRKFASGILPPRPPGPPPSWAFGSSERCDGLQEGGMPLSMKSADGKV